VDTNPPNTTRSNTTASRGSIRRRARWSSRSRDRPPTRRCSERRSCSWPNRTRRSWPSRRPCRRAPGSTFSTKSSPPGSSTSDWVNPTPSHSRPGWPAGASNPWSPSIPPSSNGRSTR